jgi:hypothetical protein
LLFLAAPLNILKRTFKLWGIIITIPNHLKISYQTEIALLQCKKRCDEVSTTHDAPNTIPWRFRGNNMTNRMIFFLSLWAIILMSGFFSIKKSMFILPKKSIVDLTFLWLAFKSC